MSPIIWATVPFHKLLHRFRLQGTQSRIRQTPCIIVPVPKNRGDPAILLLFYTNVFRCFSCASYTSHCLHSAVYIFSLGCLYLLDWKTMHIVISAGTSCGCYKCKAHTVFEIMALETQQNRKDNG